MDDTPVLIGRVTRCSIRGFVGGIRLTEPDMPTFGSFCKAAAQRGHSHVIGLIYEISIEDDELARQLAIADAPPDEVRVDNQFTRPVPIEIRALTVGYQNEGGLHWTLPPQPPLTLADIHMLTANEVRDFTDRFDFLTVILSASELPTDDLLVAALRQAAAVRPKAERRRYLVQAGRECSRLLSHDLTRLSNLTHQLAA
jgi:hypothetical protein